MKQGTYLAIDTAYEQGLLVLFSKDRVLLEIPMASKLDHAKDICGAMEQAIAYCKEHNLVLKAAFCGLGPGSFVGIRIALATLLGFCSGADLPLMGFCSHRALLDFYKDCFIYMKASGDLGYLSGFSFKDGQMIMSLSSKVVPMSELSNLLPEGALLLSDQADKLSIPAQRIVGPMAQGIFAACAKRLDAIIDEKSFIKPNYVKPPSVTLPAPKI